MKNLKNIMILLFLTISSLQPIFGNIKNNNSDKSEVTIQSKQLWCGCPGASAACERDKSKSKNYGHCK